jgi:hypothetical protein
MNTISFSSTCQSISCSPTESGISTPCPISCQRAPSGDCTETIHFQRATVFRDRVIGPLKRRRETFSQRLLRQSMSASRPPIHQFGIFLVGRTRIRAPRGIALTRFMRNLVAATFPCAVTSSFKVNIIVTKFVFWNRSVYCANCVTASPGWKLTVASVREEFAAVVSLVSSPSHSGHESMISNSTVVSRCRTILLHEHFKLA